MISSPTKLIFVIILCLYIHLANAFPRYLTNTPNGTASDIDHILEPRQLGGLLGSLGSLVGVIPTTLDLAPVVAIGRKIIPDKEHPFMVPGPTDIRGGCPGLNIMANYGYIPRNGITTMAEMTYGMEEMLGFGPDLSLVLVAFALKTSVDLTTLKMSIGRTDSRTDGPLTGLLGTAPGLFSAEAHNKYEIDGSLAYEDAYFADGQTDQFSGDRWKKYRQVAIDHFGGIMTTRWIGEVRFMQYKECRALNPNCHWAGVDQLAFYAAQALTSTSMTSSGEDGIPLPPDVRSIEKFFGITENVDGSLSKTDSRLPPGPDGNWYRRAVPSTFVEFAETLATTYLQHTVPFGNNGGRLGHWNADFTQVPNQVAPNVACYILQRARDPKDSRYADGAVAKALEVLLGGLLEPVFQQLSCS